MRVAVLHVRCPSDEVELACDRLWSAGATGIEVGAGDPSVLVAGFGDRIEPTAVADALPWPAEVVDVDDQAWVESQKAAVGPVRTGRFVVVPPWADPPTTGPGDIVLSIDPGPTFGHGGHPSTRLALAALDVRVTPGRSVLDVGSGSGVLAIAAARLGADPVVAIDVDLTATSTTGWNAVRNEVEVTAARATVDQLSGPFHLAVANVTIDVHEQTAPILAGLVEGPLIVSGLLDDQVERAVAAYARPVATRTTDQGWTCLTFTDRDSG